MKAVVLLNEGAGTLAGLDANDAQMQIARGFSAAGAQADVRFVEPRFLRAIAQEAARGTEFDAIFAGGGDGTINTIANVVADSDKAFGVLPLGTHNHFAKDLKVPLDLDEAIVALAQGRVTDLPVAEVNGHLFLNFSAIGLHPEVVKDREAQREEIGRGKWQAMTVAMWRGLKSPPVHRVTLSARGRTIARRTPSVIICNNPHQMEVFGVADASVPERGLLNVYVTTRAKRGTLIWLMFRAAAGAISEKTKHFESFALPEFRVDSKRKVLPVSVDGEVTDMATPLIYKVRERPLRVLKPAPPATTPPPTENAEAKP
jgi:diacylglycerol kinase family enzyme